MKKMYLEVLEQYVDDVCDDIACGNGLSDRDTIFEVFGMLRYAYSVCLICKDQRESFVARLREALKICDNR